MNRKKIITIILVVLIALVLAGGIYYFTKEDQNTLTVSERQWIEDNKNRLIDLSIPSETPVLSSNGEGVIFDFLESLEEDTNLEFNKLSYDTEEKPSSTYAINITDKAKDSDILIYQDNYALVTKTKTKYNKLSDIKNIVVGCLEDNMTNISKYLDTSGEITYKSYKDYDTMINDMDGNSLDAIVMPKLQYLDEILSNENLNIAYNITEYTQDYVLTLGNTKTLNRILTKYYDKWQKENFEETFSSNIINTYFKTKEVDEKEQVKFRSKRYSYGFVLNSPFDVTTKDGLKGFNHSFISEFAKATNIEINYKKYSNIDALVKDFEANKLDIIFDYHAKNKYNMDVYNTSPVYDESIAIITDQNTNTVVNNISSLDGKTVLAVKDSKIEQYLTENNVKTKTYNNINDLINRLGKNDIAAIDYYTYDYYVRTDLSDYKALNIIDLDEEYSFISRDIKANETFNELFDFYLSFENTNKMINEGYKELLELNHSNKLLQTLLIIFSAILLILVGILTGKFIKYRKNNHRRLSKVDKLRYVDTMTSLKNRNYLNDHIEVWDNSEAYPQAIIIIDLNNVAYINDNFGHAEGDKVIVEGAGVLIANQLPNSEIIRTNGNEFLIFMVGHDEKTIITYIRKLHKEFKNLSHGFGAAIGYSMITDEIKTIDDAVNEATSDMRDNKDDK